MICPKCGRQAVVLVHNVEDGSVFCPGCAPASFNPHGILTLADLDFMRRSGIDPGLPESLKRLVEKAKCS